MLTSYQYSLGQEKTRKHLALACSLVHHNNITPKKGLPYSSYTQTILNLSYNGSIFAKEHLGYLLTFDKLIDTSAESGLVFRPLSPRLETKLYLVWKKYQTFSPIAEKFLSHVKQSFLGQ